MKNAFFNICIAFCILWVLVQIAECSLSDDTSHNTYIDSVQMNKADEIIASDTIASPHGGGLVTHYEEGYKEGYENGRFDGSQGHPHGYSHKDLTKTSSNYAMGYKKGYDEGYKAGKDQ